MTITKKVSRGVKISSGLVLLGLIAGTFLSKWLPNFDGGNGVLPVNGSHTAESKTPPPEDPEGTTEPAGTRDVLLITIKGRSYWIPSDVEGEAQEISLTRAVELAVATAGDENGIRIRVKRDGTARAKAEEDLEQALLDAGIARKAIVGLEQTTP